VPDRWRCSHIHTIFLLPAKVQFFWKKHQPFVGSARVISPGEGVLELARRQGSVEQEYTDVHGVCDIAHTQELYHALEAEMTLAHDAGENANFFEGVDLLVALIRKIVTG
jgi:hypothetical protein